MGDVLSGLESMGLGNLSNIDLFNDKKEDKAEEEKKKAAKAAAKAAERTLEEKDLIYFKTIECVCCGHEFKERVVRSGKVKLLAQDIDFLADFTLAMADAVKCPVSREIPDSVKIKLDEYLLRKRRAER